MDGAGACAKCYLEQNTEKEYNTGVNGSDELRRFGKGGQHIEVDVMALAVEATRKSPTPIRSLLLLKAKGDVGMKK
jgi:hypothetical protein